MSGAIKERPILFNGEMVNAIRAGRKTQTRRVIKQSHAFKIYSEKCTTEEAAAHRNMPLMLNPNEEAEAIKWLEQHSPFGVPGDQLWVRETWAGGGSCDPGVWIYRADYPSCVPAGIENIPPAEEVRWKPSIHMPRSACRLVLEVTEVRAERVASICESDAVAEGAEPNWSGPLDDWKPELHGYYSKCPCGEASCECTNGHDTATDWFRDLWDSINAGRGFGWDVNPWVWAVEFKVVEGLVKS